MFSYREAASILKSNCEALNPSIGIQGASIDSRKIEPGNLFVALKTERNDGHRYLDEAFLKGASGALVSKDYFETTFKSLDKKSSSFQNLIPVEHTADAFLKLSQGYRDHLNLECVGVTGSVGKTSTKEFLTYLLKTQAPTYSSVGNLNNHLGVPLSIFQMQVLHRYAVLELGASARGEILKLAQVIRPKIGIVTQVSPAHLAGFGRLQDVYDTKCELLQGIMSGGAAVLPEHDNLLIQRAHRLGLKVKRVGYSSEADYSISKVASDSKYIRFTLNGKYSFRFPGQAAFLVKNAALALAACSSLGIAFEDLPEEWEGFKIPAGRFQERIYSQDIRLIDDSYNASPVSFDRAIEAFSSLPGSRKVLFISDMLELGPMEQVFHDQLGRRIAREHYDQVIGYGTRTRWTLGTLQKETREPSRIKYFENFNEAAEYLMGQITAEDSVLIKGSRGMKVDQVIPMFEARFGSPVV